MAETTGTVGAESDATSSRLDDRQWLDLFNDIADGRTAALEKLYHQVASRLYGLAQWRTGSREDAGDVVQEVFVYLAEHRDRLRRVRSPERWLMTVTHRKAIDVLRRRQRRQSAPLDEACFFAAPEQGSRRLDAARASALLARLPAVQREVIFLRHFADCTFAGIASIVGVPTFTAASRYRLGIARLRRLMGG
ncbi:MAG: RNA polymerase sigma factor [Pirellulales bacterium]